MSVVASLSFGLHRCFGINSLHIWAILASLVFWAAGLILDDTYAINPEEADIQMLTDNHDAASCFGAGCQNNFHCFTLVKTSFILGRDAALLMPNLRPLGRAIATLL